MSKPPLGDSLLRDLIGAAAMEALRQYATVGRVDEAAYELLLEAKAAEFTGSDLNCACLVLTAVDGVTTVSYGDTVTMLSATGDAYEGRETVTKVRIPEHTRYKVTRVTDRATLHLTGVLATPHRLILIMLYMEYMDLLMPPQARRPHPPHWI